MEWRVVRALRAGLSQRVLFALFALFTLFTLLTLGLSWGCMIDVGDQACTEDSVATDKTDRCPYGPPGGPKVAGGECPAVTLEQDPAKCTVTWANDVFPIFDDPARGNCTNAGCHGSAPGAKGVFLPPGDAAGSFIALKSYLNDQQAPYLSDETPTQTWMLCSLQGTAGGGSPMPPPSGLDAASFVVAKQWTACGMHLAP